MATEWTADEIRRVGRLVVDLIADHLTSLPGRPAFSPMPAALAQEMAATPPPAAIRASGDGSTRRRR